MNTPILRDFPYSFESNRLTIRGPLPGDGNKLRKAVIETQAELKPWMPWAVNILSEEEYEAFVREGQLKFLAREDMLMLLLLKGTETIVGGSGLHRIDWDVPKFEIGYWVRTNFARKGYITEAVARISEFAFDDLEAKRVEIRCDARNSRSAAVARRLDFTHEATLIHDRRNHLTNELRNTFIFAKTRP